MIVADDLGFSDLGAYGGEISTPNLDRLAREGLRFTQFYNNAVCNVSRLSMMTGLYPRFGEAGLLRPNMVTLSEVLKQAGYATVLTGKWHLGRDEQNRPTARGFNEYYGVPSGACNYFDPAMPEAIDGPLGRRPFWHNRESVDHFPDDFYTTDAFTRHAVENIQRLSAGSQPFFVNVCYTAPHYPLQAREHDVMRYRGRYDKGYFELRKSRYRRLVELGLIRSSWELPDADPKLGSWYYDYEIEPWGEVKEPEQARRRMEVYAAMVESLDRGIGRIIDALETSGVRRKTLVLFFSDNGGCASLPANTEAYKAYNHGVTLGSKESYEFCGPGWGWAQNAPFRRYKTWLYEGGIATPFIASWPGIIRPGLLTHDIGHVVDLMPTLLEIAGEQGPKAFRGKAVLPLEGKSLMPLLMSQKHPGHEAIFWQLFGNRAVRQDKWKLVWGVTRGQWELYDMEADRTEVHDLAGSHRDLVARLSEAWLDWAGRHEVNINSTEVER